MDIHNLSLSESLVKQIEQEVSTPVYIYHVPTMKAQAEIALGMPHAFGLTVRYAMKACSTRAILQFFDKKGLHMDASSVFEVQRALLAGIPPYKISLSTQELPEDFADLINKEVLFNACSLNQLEIYGQRFPNTAIGVRINPGIGSGHSKKTTVGGASSSFGIWHELVPQIKQICERYQLTVERIHTHIGSGTDPIVWEKVAQLSLNSVQQFSKVKTLNLGGGFKVDRMKGGIGPSLESIGKKVQKAFTDFAHATGRELHLEIEPGTFLMANAGYILSRVQDKVSTGKEGYTFLKLDTGMTEILRPTLYGAEHPMTFLRQGTGEAKECAVVVGHCCESADMLTCKPNQPEVLGPRSFQEISIGDLCLIGGAGAYCSSLSATNYNSFPQVPEVFVFEDGSYRLIKARQTMHQMLVNEV